MDLLICKGSEGAGVDQLRSALSAALGSDSQSYPSLAQLGVPVDTDFDSAIKRWQSGVGIIADGIAGPRCQLLLGLIAPPDWEAGVDVSVSIASQLFPATKPANIARYLPYIEAALRVAQLTDRAMVLGAFGTIRAETEGFVPIAEFPSKFNSLPGHPPFSSYDNRASLGNDQPGDGQRYRGRGFVQLTGKANYREYGQRINVGLEAFPDMANAPEVAAVLLALFLADRATKFRAAVAAGRLDTARKLVNGGSHGLDRFTDVFTRAATVMKASAPVGRKAARDKPAATKPIVKSRRTRASKTHRDAGDLRDRAFMPAPISLDDEFPSQETIRKFLPAYANAGLILDQGHEGACTGFGLSCVINYLRWLKSRTPAEMASVSPRMIYTLARRYDEYEGENYEGSSCRGAIKGWFNNGVCFENDWPYKPDQSDTAKYGFAARATQNTLGVYYRIDKSAITDLQAAIAQHGAIFVSAFTHSGWDNVPRLAVPPQGHPDIPVIDFDGRPSNTDGHAFALVGYNANGFVVQNSWGRDWGAEGFAVVTYLDWLANGMDSWVVALGVPGVVAGRLAVAGPSSARMAGADHSDWWDATLAYRHSIVLGNDGRVTRYLTEDEPPRKLQQQAFVLPNEWFRAQSAARKRLVIYVHGGLNSEDEAIKRARAMGRYFVGNGCYPLFLVWKTGLLESIGDLFGDAFRPTPARAGAGFGEWVTEKSDLVLEKTVGRPAARPLWSEMKENAELAFADRRGGDLLLDALQSLVETWGEQFELHLVGHSAGSIAMGHLLSAIDARRRAGRDGNLSQRLTSLHMYAPACTVSFANRHYANDPNVMQRLYLDILSDKNERDDNVATIYRKSLLYFISNSLEADVHAPILGLDRVNHESDSGWDGSADTGEALSVWRQAAEAANLHDRTTLVEPDRINVARGANGQMITQAAAHGGFDNDIEVVTRTLERITGSALALPVDDLRGY